MKHTMLIAAVVMLCCLPACQKPQYPARLDNLPLIDLSGSPVRLPFQPERILIVNLWATWCKPCKAEISQLSQLQGEFAAQGFDIIGISLDLLTPQDLQPIVTALGITYPVFIGDTGRVLGELGVTAIPATLFIDSSGFIIKKLVGYHAKQEVLGAMQEILKEHSPSIKALRKSDA